MKNFTLLISLACEGNYFSLFFKKNTIFAKVKNSILTNTFYLCLKIIPKD